MYTLTHNSEFLSEGSKDHKEHTQHTVMGSGTNTGYTMFTFNFVTKRISCLFVSLSLLPHR